jgi:putative integral membrane protein (TIGR02587 family)
MSETNAASTETYGSGVRAASTTHGYLLALSRAYGGALFFALPLLLTMEMWWLGFYMDPLRLGLLMVVMFPVLTSLSYSFPWRRPRSWIDAPSQAATAYAVALTMSGMVLGLIGVLRPPLFDAEMVGKIGVQMVPAGIGAVAGAGQFAPEQPQASGERRERAGYPTELYFMFAGALYLAISVAPTEEMILIAFKMTYWHAVGLALASLLVMHVLVYAIDFRRRHVVPATTPQWKLFLHFSLVGYAIALLVSAYILWTFGRLDHTALGPILVALIVLAFPASLGAAAARLIL